MQKVSRHLLKRENQNLKETSIISVEVTNLIRWIVPSRIGEKQNIFCFEGCEQSSLGVSTLSKKSFLININ